MSAPKHPLRFTTPANILVVPHQDGTGHQILLTGLPQESFDTNLKLASLAPGEPSDQQAQSGGVKHPCDPLQEPLKRDVLINRHCCHKHARRAHHSNSKHGSSEGRLISLILHLSKRGATDYAAFRKKYRRRSPPVVAHGYAATVDATAQSQSLGRFVFRVKEHLADNYIKGYYLGSIRPLSLRLVGTEREGVILEIAVELSQAGGETKPIITREFLRIANLGKDGPAIVLGAPWCQKAKEYKRTAVDAY